MNVKELMDKKENEHKTEMRHLRNFAFLGDIDFIAHISVDTVFTNHVDDLELARRTIRKVCGKRETLGHYYVSHTNKELVVLYNYREASGEGDFCVAFFTDLEYLEKISGGKCKIKEKEETETKLYLECEMEVE